VIEFLPLKKVNEQYASEIHAAVGRVIDSGWYLQSDAVRRFEADYARYIGVSHCVGCANGLDAIVGILRGYIEMGEMEEGDEIIVPANTFLATVLAVTQSGLKPVLVEPTFNGLVVDENRLEDAVTDRTRGIIIVHLYGRCAYTEEIRRICVRHHLKLIEDNAQAHGCEWNGVKTGALGDAAAHSFYPGKLLGALGDAGAVTTNDERLATVCRALGNYGFSKKYVASCMGRNSRLDEIQAAVLDVKLKHLDEEIEKRQVMAEYYYTHISHPQVRLPLHVGGRGNVYHLFPIFCEQRGRLKAFLAERGIQTVIHYPVPPHRQSCYPELNLLSLPVTERIHREELSLPISSVLALVEAEAVVNAVNNFKIR